ncbi:MAG TPA: EAL domain-containing protein [Acetobacteraceae bacterium]|jgi:EAL domain-containing protein (putative c-di-GMP-specific phosphodiesterase class I)|nr:EAL domain-containing protein [Acetobacteraceae bacterium]
MNAPDSTQRPLGDRDRFVAFAFAAADLLLEVGTDGRATFAAGAFRARLGRAPESLVGRRAAEVVAPEDRDALATALALLPSRGRLPPTTLRLADAARTPMAVSGIFLPAAGQPARLCLCLAPLPSPAEASPVTGDALLREARARLLPGAAPVWLGLLDVGAAGAALGPILAEEAGRGTLTAQLAPGRFGLLADEGADIPDLAQVTRRLEAALGTEAGGARVTARSVPLDAGGLTSAQAAQALRHGLAAFARFGAEGLRGAGFEDGLAGVVAVVAGRAAALRRGIADRRFRLDFQPIVDLATREVHHHEALLRPEPGLLAPGEDTAAFVSMVEMIGMTEELDVAVGQLAAAATAALRPGRRVAFNVSGLSAQSPAFRSRLLALLDGNRTACGRLMVELTESAAIEDEELAAGTLEAARDRGLPVCIDDFGAGAAAFRYLRAFRVDYVKVDGSFVAAALASERDRSFVAAMVDLSLAVGAQVIAERIETEEEAAVMHALGVHHGQGWLFGRPGPL